MLERSTSIADLVEAYPDAVGFLISEGLPCVVCGEPFWGTIEDLALQKGWDHDAIDGLVQRMRMELNQQ